MTPTHRYPRSARVNELVREVLADELERLDDSLLSLVTVTGVEVAPNLKTAKVFFTALAGDEWEEGSGSGESASMDMESVKGALEKVRPHLQSALGRQVRLKYVPKLVFVEDPAIEQGLRIEAILRDLHEHDD